VFWLEIKVPSSWTTLINNCHPSSSAKSPDFVAIPIIDKHVEIKQLERRIADDYFWVIRTARAINSDFTTDQVRIFKKRNKEFEQIF
jgi:hypothetical protein